MKRKGIFAPTIEDIIELSGIEALHPGGMALTKRVAEIAELRPGIKLLDVSSGRGTQSIFYAKNYDVEVIGLDLSEEMINTAKAKAKLEGVDNKVIFKLGDSQNLPFKDNMFDVVINECAVGIPDDSQKVLDEMVRVTKLGGIIVIHESTWSKSCDLSSKQKEEFSERYGTTPLEYDEWVAMLKEAGVKDIISEFDEWSKPEMFWKIRKDRDVKHPNEIFTSAELKKTMSLIVQRFGQEGLNKALENQKIFFNTLLQGKIGYCLFKGTKN